MRTNITHKFFSMARRSNASNEKTKIIKKNFYWVIRLGGRKIKREFWWCDVGLSITTQSRADELVKQLSFIRYHIPSLAFFVLTNWLLKRRACREDEDKVDGILHRVSPIAHQFTSSIKETRQETHNIFERKFHLESLLNWSRLIIFLRTDQWLWQVSV